MELPTRMEISSQPRRGESIAGESLGALCPKAIHFRPQCGRLRERGLTLFCPREFLIDACFCEKAEKRHCYGISADAIAKTAGNGAKLLWKESERREEKTEAPLKRPVSRCMQVDSLGSTCTPTEGRNAFEDRGKKQGHPASKSAPRNKE